MYSQLGPSVANDAGSTPTPVHVVLPTATAIATGKLSVGQLGNGDMNPRTAPTPVAFPP
jgi:hypothetical protein